MTSLSIPDSALKSAAGKVVVITGGASGIGKAASELFHSLGSKVVIGDLNEKAGNEVASSLGEGAKFQVCDVTKWDSIYNLFETAVAEYGRVDIALANAGVPEIEDIFEDRVDSEGRLKEPKYIVLEIDLKGVLASEYYLRSRTIVL
jgi:NAD(P)-dependent dehydrogenase (short-subunit alcohol dehydrogenase family)